MKCLKILGLAIVAAMTLMGLAASSASATALYNGETKMGVGSVLKWSLESGTKVVWTETSGQFALAECSASTIKGKITNAGGSSATVSSSIEELTWGSCSFPTSTVTNGGLEFHQVGTGTNGTVTTNAEIGVTINTVLFGSCVYGWTKGTDIGIITTGIPATLHAHGVALKRSGSSFACPETATWEASYISTEPSAPGPLRFENA